MRVPLGNFGAGTHTVTINSAGPDGQYFYFDFLEIASPTTSLPVLPQQQLSLATDWDTYHSLCLAPERTAWLIASLGCCGRVNHYAGALWFYELVLSGHQYASGMVEFVGAPVFGPGQETQITIGRTDDPTSATVLTHLHLIGDTAETIAKAFELAINNGYMAVRAWSQGNVLTIYSRTLGTDGNNVTIGAAPASGSYYAQASGATLAGGIDGNWYTDLQATPRLNRAARDWTSSFFAALKAQGMDGTAALSMELQNGDPSVAAGIAQRCPAGDPVLLPTPSLQTNFSPTSLAFWQEAYAELAQLMQGAGLRPYLQFGEVQWWYFRDNRSGMPFYDDYTKSAFQAAYGRTISTITDNTVSPSDYPQETAFLPTLIGNFTSAIISYVRTNAPTCRFEVLYPLDVNATAFNQAINFPKPNWTPAQLDCLKTENFGYTYARNLDECQTSIAFPLNIGFPPQQSAHLTGISDPTTPWEEEVRLAMGKGLNSVVLFALDQLCLIGYALPLPPSSRRSSFQG